MNDRSTGAAVPVAPIVWEMRSRSLKQRAAVPVNRNRRLCHHRRRNHFHNLFSYMMDPEKRKQVYRSYLQREGPQKLGDVVWPEPKQGALRGIKLLATGILETIDRHELNQLLADCSAHVMSGISKKLDILIVGRDAGPAKLQKAEEFNLKQMQEAEFLSFLNEKLANYDEQADDAPESAATAKKPAAKRKTPKKSADDGDGQDAKPKSGLKKKKK